MLPPTSATVWGRSGGSVGTDRPKREGGLPTAPDALKPGARWVEGIVGGLLWRAGEGSPEGRPDLGGRAEEVRPAARRGGWQPTRRLFEVEGTIPLLAGTQRGNAIGVMSFIGERVPGLLLDNRESARAT